MNTVLNMLWEWKSVAGKLDWSFCGWLEYRRSDWLLQCIIFLILTSLSTYETRHV